MLANGCGGGGGCTSAVPPCNACGRTVDLHNPFVFVQDLEGCGGGGGGGYGSGGGGCCSAGGGGGSCAAPPMCGASNCAPPSDCNSCCSYYPFSMHWSCSYYNPPFCCPTACSPTACSAPACSSNTCSAPACCPSACSAPACGPMPSTCSAPAACPMPSGGGQCAGGAQPSCCAMPMGGGQCMHAPGPPLQQPQAVCSATSAPTCPVELSNPFFFMDDFECPGCCGADNNADSMTCCGSLYEPLCRSTYQGKGSIPYGISGLCGLPYTKLFYGSIRTNLDCLRTNGLQDTCHLRGRFPPCRPCG